MNSSVRTAVRGLAVGSAMAVAGVVVAAPAAQAATFFGYEMTFQAPNSRQWEVRPDGTPNETFSALAAGTGPAIAALPAGLYQEAFVGSDRTWWVANSVNGGFPVDPVLKVRAGTSAAIAADSAGSWVTVAQFDDGLLRVYDSASNLFTMRTASVPNSSPSVTALPNGTFQIAFVAFDNHVWVANYTRGKAPTPHLVTSGFAVRAGTSPAIAADRSGGWHIAVQASTSRLWEIDTSAGSVIETPSAMNTGTSPAVAALSTGGYVTAFVASSGVLWWGDAGGGHATDLVPDGSPSIAGDLSGGWKAAFIGANNNFLWTFDSTMKPDHFELEMASHTTPGIAGLVS